MLVIFIFWKYKPWNGWYIGLGSIIEVTESIGHNGSIIKYPHCPLCQAIRIDYWFCKESLVISAWHNRVHINRTFLTYKISMINQMLFDTNHVLDTHYISSEFGSTIELISQWCLYWYMLQNWLSVYKGSVSGSWVSILIQAMMWGMGSCIYTWSQSVGHNSTFSLNNNDVLQCMVNCRTLTQPLWIRLESTYI